MEIDITDLFAKDTWAFSGSIATHGAGAGPATWRAALGEASEAPPLKTEDEIDAMRAWAKDTGAWNAKEIAAWSDAEVCALFVQLVAGDMREAGLDDIALDDDEAWTEYEKGAKDGRYSGALYRSDDHAHVFYSLSN